MVARPIDRRLRWLFGSLRIEQVIRPADVKALAAGDRSARWVTPALRHAVHFRLGAPLARLEGRAALARPFDRNPGLSSAADPADLRRQAGLIMRGPA